MIAVDDAAAHAVEDACTALNAAMTIAAAAGFATTIEVTTMRRMGRPDLPRLSATVAFVVPRAKSDLASFEDPRR